MKKVGVIGGLGPETSAKFCLNVDLACSKITDKRPNILVSNVGLPLSIESQIIAGKNRERVLPFLVNSARQLQKAGADFIAIPCNTVHIFIEEIRASVDIPVLSIIEESAEFLKKMNQAKIGLLGTKITVNDKLLDKKLNISNIKIILPTTSEQATLTRIINRLVKSRALISDKKALEQIISNLADRGVDCVLLACTDLQLLVKSHKRVRIFDTLQFLEKSTVREIIASDKN